MQSLGNRLKELRKQKRWTLAEVANRLGLRGHSTYSNWEYDRTEPDAEMLAKLAELYGVSVDWLTGKKNSDFDINEIIIREIVAKYNIDLTDSGKREKLEQIVKLVLDDQNKKQ